MKKELLNILIKLHETNSWDLASLLAKWVFNIQEIKQSYITSIIWFLKIAKKQSKDKVQIENLELAITNLQALRKQEQEEKKNENYEEILEKIF